MKNSVQSLTREARRRRRVAVGSRRKSKETGRGEMRERWEMSEEGRGEERVKVGVEVEERKVTNREATRTTRGGWEPELHTDRQTGQRIEPTAVQGGQAEDQSCLPSLPGSPPRR